MTEIQILEGQKDVSSPKGTTLKKNYSMILIRCNYLVSYFGDIKKKLFNILIEEQSFDRINMTE